ncbi:phosphopantetheine-binding protein [Polymorphospora sp. NPDC051019]|uniref:acyl carrier protein n=1 Tax=Polymorphospora sp. NPDC051019 TaxID=3155725 RepID=UPI0034257156
MDKADVLAELRTIYAEALEYPKEVLTPDAHLEAELGIDSLKQTELLNRVTEHFGMERVPDDGVETLDRIATAVLASARRTGSK